MSDNRRISARDEKVIIAMLGNPSLRTAAKCAGLAESTLRRKMQNEEFMSAYERIRQRVLNNACGRLQYSISTAVAILCELMNKDQPASIRLGAASKIIDYALRSNEMLNLEYRMSEVERILNARGK